MSKVGAGYVAFALLSGLYLLPFMRVLLLWSNEGTLASGAVRVLNGEVFARDFFEVMGPGTFYFLAGLFKLLGATFAVLRLYVFLVSWGTGILLYALTRCLGSAHRVLPSLMAAATCYGLQWPGASHHTDGNFFALSSVLCIALWNERRGWLLLMGSGALAGVAACVHQPKGLLLTVAIVFWLLMRWRTERREASAPLLVLASFFLVVGSVCWYFWSQQALGSLYYVNVVWPSQHYGTVNQVGYALGIFHEYWRGWAFQPGWLNWSTAMASILVIPLLYVAVLPLIVSMLLLTKARRALGPAGSLYLACGVAMWISESHRHDIYHLVFGSPLLVIVSLHLLSNLKGRGVSWAVQGLAVTAGCLAAVNLLSACTAKTVPTRAGVVGLYKNDGLIAALQARVQRGDKIFVYPYRPIFYFLTRTVNPTRFLTLTYNYNTTEEFQDAIRSLEESRVRYVAWDQNFQAKVAPVVFSPAAMHPPSGFLMEDYLRSHYHAVSDIDGVVLMERNGDITLH